MIHHFIFVKVRLLQENHEERNFIMEFIASIFILTGFIGLFIGAKGLLTGKIQFLNIFSRKKSGQFLALMFVVMIVGGALMPTDPIEDTKDDEAQTEEIAGSETKKPNGQEEEKNNTEDRADENEEVNGEKDKTDEANSEQNDNTEQAANAEQSETLHGELEVHFVDVGQGHAQVIVTPNHRVMVIDGGNNDDEDDMVAYLKQLGVERVDILIGTHPDADHIGGIDSVIDHFEIGEIYMPKVQRDTKTFESVLIAIQNKGLKVKTAKSGLSLSLDENVKVDMIAPIGDHEDANEMSAVVRIQYGKRSFLLTGDAGVDSETKMIASGVNLKSDVLLVGHHGSNSSTSQVFLDHVQPDYAVIQVGKNSYGHPTEEVLSRLNQNGAKIYRNDTDGTIIFTTDGETLTVNKKNWVYIPKEKEKNSQPSNGGQNPPASGGSTGGQGGTIGTVTQLSVSAAIDDPNPSQNEQVTVTVTVKDQNGAAVNGAKVTLTLHYKSKNTVYEGTTNSKGVAVLPFKIGRAAKGFTVEGDIKVTYSGKTATASTSFTPQ